jgi:phenylpropionate dioxygenase-like ring-hydroxylating dioxygenase large terminal subunit
MGLNMLEAFAKLPPLPRRRYVDPEFYRLELEHVFRRRWLLGANACELPKPGSYLTLDLPFAPVFLVRGQDDKVRAFLNSCSHRGAKIARGEKGCSRLLTCRRPPVISSTPLQSPWLM